jgi:hypothetical protein
MDFKPKHLQREKELGRFKNMRTSGEAPWKGSNECLQYIGWLVESGLLRVPYGWPSMINYFHKNHKKGITKMKIAEALAFCGDRGVYLLALVDLDPAVKAVFIEVINVSCGLIKKANSKTDLKQLEKRLAFALTQLEIMLPMFWNTSTRHVLLHIGRHIKMLGSFWAFSMLGVERYHVTLKQLVRYTNTHTSPTHIYMYLHRCIILLYSCFVRIYTCIILLHSNTYICAYICIILLYSCFILIYTCMVLLHSSTLYTYIYVHKQCVYIGK